MGISRDQYSIQYSKYKCFIIHAWMALIAFRICLLQVSVLIYTKEVKAWELQVQASPSYIARFCLKNKLATTKHNDNDASLKIIQQPQEVPIQISLFFYDNCRECRVYQKCHFKQILFHSTQSQTMALRIIRAEIEIRTPVQKEF